MFLALSSIVPSVVASYALLHNFTGTSFLSGFNFFSGSDPTHGFVRYQSEADARSQDLVAVSDNSIYIGVDYKNKAPNGRASVRIESKELYKKGLFVLDLAHMPSSTCGTWPSFWTWGSEGRWPDLGEIDIIEGIHTNTINAFSVHTAEGCSIDGKGMFCALGTLKTLNCYIGAPGQLSNAGCGTEASSPSSFGSPFNAAGGGVYAMEWTSQFIKMWFFPRNAIPTDLDGSGTVDPAGWGTPQANFQGACDFDKMFGEQRIVLDTTFCGDWAGAVWDSCKKVGSDCNTYVANNPEVFKESYWRVNYLRIFE
ncbi:glycoside hydrolase family 16 protein [Cucurbitaria berberidis CBS 394.84]|uniref:endo-1,3(4)-beta-glucanase n=1 Tax=Cucurbitaria berberidis CBS 394.84 TaxID=1168544 RepID=A0A9P4GR97_9PLEO|nr:glycoside hydrolase family 16 protein [Cucurbitaria berberidis CBS 394.84]KAF1849916.1 glycoside hydrolase family 16 protein [Cucurbitaria berberidis CBS 394.84]